MLITLTPGGTGRREEVALQIREVAPTDSRGGPHHVCGVILCSMWHFALREMDSRGGPYEFKRWPPPRVWCGTLLRVTLSSIQDPPDASTIVGYILVIPTPGMLCRTPV